MRSAALRFDPSCRILIADPDSDTRELYRETLRGTGCDVIDAADGRDALVRALVHRPSLVITETRLPGFDGYALCGVLRRDLVTRSVPILVVTSDSRKPEIDRAREAGADSVLIKPITPNDLLAEVQRLIRSRREVNQEPPPPPATTSPRRRMLNAHARFSTTTPPIAPPTLYCQACGLTLTYQHSYVGGVSQKHPEQWDRFECPRGCGSFEYRVRTRKLRKLQDDRPPARRAVNDG